MELTKKVKDWLIANADVKADLTDEEFKKVLAESLISGKLSTEEYTKLTKTSEQKAADAFSEQISTMNTNISKLTDLLTAKEDKPEDKEEKAEEETEEKDKEDDTKSTPTPKPVKALAKLFSQHGDSPEDEDKGFDIRVKEAAEMYSTDRKAVTYPSATKNGRPHPLAGHPVHDFAERGRVMESSSELDMAVCGAYAQFLCASRQRGGSRTFGFQALPQHSKELFGYALEKMKWGGASDGGDFADIKSRLLTGNEQKAVIDDATSGGLEAAPIVFDDAVIQAPLLHGELFPLVNTIPLDRGRRVEGVSTGTVTGSWGGVDDSAITLFTTTSYVSAFDTTIFRWEGAIEIGLDFLSDTPIDFGAHVTSQYGERLLEDLDDVVASGNGTTQPEGVINKTGTTSIAFGATTSIGNYESLRFGVAKPEHRGPVGASAVFCGTETSYQRVRALPVGASDARRLGGMDYDSYSWMERPYKINESLTNAQLFYAILARYRMYRRRGLTMRTSTEGDTLIRQNNMLMVAMARYGGQLERGASGAITTTAPV